MNELYWITVLGNVHNITIACMIIGFIVNAVVGIGMIGTCFENHEYFKRAVKLFKYTSIAFIAATGLYIFIPSKSELYLIYGIGGTLDYLKTSKEAKKIPENALKAVNKWLELQNKNELNTHHDTIQNKT